LLENTQGGSGKASGDADFWRKASQALLCAIIGYLVEVLPIEQRNFSNVLERLWKYMEKRKRALEVEKRKKAQARAVAEKELGKMTLKEADETKSKEQLTREMAEKENAARVESSDVLQKYKVSQMQILDSYSPMYEFD